MKHCDSILSLLEKEYGGIGPALHFGSVYQLLVAVMLSAQTNDNQVNKVTEPLFALYPTAEDMIKLSPEELESYLHSIGLYKNKAKNLAASNKILVEKYAGEVPCTREELTSLPGVGRKTANVILSVGFGEPALAVDTHVFRVAHRLAFSFGKTPDAVETDLCRIIPRERWAEAHHWFIWHGRKLCKKQKPSCDICFLQDLCYFFSEQGGNKK